MRQTTSNNVESAPICHPPVAVAHVSENHRAEWPREEPNEEEHERVPQRLRGIARWEEVHPDDIGEGTEQREFVPLEHRTRRGRHERAEAVGSRP
eukprot:CAMPEP_0179986802 /NCGR_PEP_ID=MMETSP0984-20121128/2436_1 /TAXON_ID=483367 /ORGANISM="non described non described, Strain CCMP 2436" /LENGTH=94 /DNA_ID=CAMNT_0021905631 /DNA_START=1068 /DNA_END=1352 /DNA_ORIENTATION=+